MNGSSLFRLLDRPRMTTRAKISDQPDADDDAELLGRDREDEVGVGVREDALDDALARPAAEPAAAQDRLERGVDLEGVAGLRRQEAVDAAGDVRQHRVGGEDAADRRARRGRRSRSTARRP